MSVHLEDITVTDSKYSFQVTVQVTVLGVRCHNFRTYVIQKVSTLVCRDHTIGYQVDFEIGESQGTRLCEDSVKMYYFCQVCLKFSS